MDAKGKYFISTLRNSGCGQFPHDVRHGIMEGLKEKRTFYPIQSKYQEWETIGCHQNLDTTNKPKNEVPTNIIPIYQISNFLL